MCFGFIKIWRRENRKPSAIIAEKSASASASSFNMSVTSRASPPTPKAVYKPPPNLGPDPYTTAAAALDSAPVVKNEKPLTTATPIKAAPSSTSAYLSTPKPSYSAGTKSHSKSSGTTTSKSGSPSYGGSSCDYGSHSSSSGGGGGCGDSSGGGGCGGGGGDSGGGGGGCGGGGGGC